MVVIGDGAARRAAAPVWPWRRDGVVCWPPPRLISGVRGGADAARIVRVAGLQWRVNVSMLMLMGGGVAWRRINRRGGAARMT